MKYTWVQACKTEWHLTLDHGIYLGSTCIASAYRHGGGWRGVVHSTQNQPDEVLFLEPDNLVDMKLLLETTVALRENSNGT